MDLKAMAPTNKMAPSTLCGRKNTRNPRYTWLLLAALLSACSPPTPRVQSLSPDATILAFGDSLTYGTGTSRDRSYPAVLQALIGRQVLNAGRPGELSAEGLARLPAVLDEIHPELLILCHGGNDILRKYNLEQTKQNLRAMVDLARKRHISVVLISVPRPGIFLEPETLYEEVATEYALPLENRALIEIASTPKLKSDAVHPNGQGYEKLARAIYGLLQRSGAI